MAGFEQLGEDLIHEGPVFRVTTGQVRSPDGRTLTREYVRHPGAVVVVPVVDGDVVLVHQYRAAIDRNLLELPAGKRDVPGEPPEVTAARELREEVGLAAGSMTLLTEFFNTPGFSDEYSYCFLATDCTGVEMERHGAEEEHMEIVRIPLGDAVVKVASGDIDDAKTIIGILLAHRRLTGE